MWKTTNYKGEQVWYSEEEYEALKKIIAELEHKIKTLQTKNPEIMTNS